jgi:hypothetical protein
MNGAGPAACVRSDGCVRNNVFVYLYTTCSALARELDDMSKLPKFIKVALPVMLTQRTAQPNTHAEERMPNTACITEVSGF